MPDGDDRCGVAFKFVDDAIVADNQLANQGIVEFRNETTRIRKPRKASRRGLHPSNPSVRMAWRAGRDPLRVVVEVIDGV
jgi:hypothetical protein